MGCMKRKSSPAEEAGRPTSIAAAALPPPAPSLLSSEISIDVRSDSEAVLSDIGLSLRAVLAAIYEGTPAPRHLEKLLGLHKTLCWRVLQVAFARDPLAAAPYLPGDEGMEKLLKAAQRAGAQRTICETVRAGVARYRDLARAHAGDRASFEVMLMSLAAPRETTVELKAARRAGYRSTSYLWGVQTAVRILAVIINPHADGSVDLATIRGHVRARRVREQGLLRLSRTIEHDTDAPDKRRVVAVPIDPDSLVGGVPILPQFSTKPLPRLDAIALPGQNVEYCFADQHVGEQSAVTIFTGEIRRGLQGARWRSEGNTSNAMMMAVRDPVGLGVIDLWAPPEFGTGHRALTVSSVGVDALRQRPDQWHVLPGDATAARLGKGLAAAHLSEVPEYEQAVAHCMKLLGWNPRDFELHRLRMEYPVVGSCLVLQTMLAERGT